MPLRTRPGGRFLYLNTSKASVVVPDGPDGAPRLGELASECDVIVTDRPEHLILGERDDATIVVAITPFGLTGPYAAYRAHHLVTFHAGGEGSILPSGAGWKRFPERAPVQIGSDIAEYDAGWNAAVAVLAACYNRLRTGAGAAHRRVGPRVGADAEPHPTQPVQQRRRHAPPRRQPLRLPRDDRVSRRLGAAGRAHTRPVGRPGRLPRRRRPCRSAHRHRGRAAADMAGAAAALLAWCRARDKAEVVRILAPLGCSVGAYATPSDLLSSSAARAPRLFPRRRRRPRRLCAHPRASVPVLVDARRGELGAGAGLVERLPAPARRAPDDRRQGAASKAYACSTSRGPRPGRTRRACSRCSAPTW